MVKGAVLEVQKKTNPRKFYLLDDMTEKAVFERMRKTGGVLGLYPELDGFMDSLGQTNKLQEARFLEFYHCGPWEYTTREMETHDTQLHIDATLFPVAGGVQPEKWYPRK